MKLSESLKRLETRLFMPGLPPQYTKEAEELETLVDELKAAGTQTARNLIALQGAEITALKERIHWLEIEERAKVELLKASKVLNDDLYKALSELKAWHFRFPDLHYVNKLDGIQPKT